MLISQGSRSSHLRKDPSSISKFRCGNKNGTDVLEFNYSDQIYDI